MKKNNVYYGLYRYDREENREVRVAVDRSEKFINNLLDSLVRHCGVNRKDFRIVHNVSRKPFALQIKFDRATLENKD